MPAKRRGRDLLEPQHRARRAGRDRRRGRTAPTARRATTTPASAPAHFTAANSAGFGAGHLLAEEERRTTASSTSTVIMSSSALEDDGREGAGGARSRVVPREKIRANDLAGARRQHAARGKARPRSRGTRCRRSSRPAVRAGTASATARIARFTNIVASDRPSQCGRARTISADHAARDRRCGETTPAGRPRGPARRTSGSVIASEPKAPSTITALRRRRGAAATCCCCHRVLRSCKMQRLLAARGIFARRRAHHRHHPRPIDSPIAKARSETSTSSATRC